MVFVGLFIFALLILTFIFMENSRTSAKDFFLHLGMMVSLYAVTIAFINLVFSVIGRAFPDMITNGYYWSQGSEISMPVATLIIVFPIFLILSRFVYKSYIESPDKKNLSIRKWLTYITLFIAGVILAGDLVTVLYKFLDGQDLTTAFLLKALTVLLVSGFVFGYYLQDIRERVSSNQRKFWAMGVALIILISIILGFAVIGSPRTQRQLRMDQETVYSLDNANWQVINYWQVNGMIPDSIPSLTPEIDYKKTGNMTYELCATFNHSNQYRGGNMGWVVGPKMPGVVDWSHNVGYHCFEMQIDPVMYPTQVRG